MNSIPLRAITALGIEGKDKIIGQLGTSKVTVTRRMNGWSVRLVIAIDDVVMHDTLPTTEEQAEYNTLFEEAYTIQSHNEEGKRIEIHKSLAFKVLFQMAEF